jgi:hypothetical protein
MSNPKDKKIKDLEQLFREEEERFKKSGKLSPNQFKENERKARKERYEKIPSQREKERYEKMSRVGKIIDRDVGISWTVLWIVSTFLWYFLGVFEGFFRCLIFSFFTTIGFGFFATFVYVPILEWLILCVITILGIFLPHSIHTPLIPRLIKGVKNHFNVETGTWMFLIAILINLSFIVISL